MVSFLSQSHLSLLATCPRKYQHTYIDGLTTPISLTQQRSMIWGSRFHQLMQQRSLGLPIASLLQQYPDFQDCLAKLEAVDPTIFGTEIRDQIRPDFLRQSEHSRSYSWPSHAEDHPQERSSHSSTAQHDRWVFRVIYDLLILKPGQAQILDWKTYPQPPKLKNLRDHWQTRLYLFVLVETTDYAPEAVSMTYWFVRDQNEAGELTPQHCTFPYDRSHHEQTREELKYWITRLEEWRSICPQIPESSSACLYCNFQQRCQRGNGNFVEPETINWAQLLDVNSISG